MKLVFRGSSGSSNVRLNYIRIVVYALLPFGIAIASWLYWHLHSVCSRLQAEERQAKTRATTIIIAFLFYPAIIRVLAQSLNCTPIDGENRLHNDLEELCF